MPTKSAAPPYVTCSNRTRFVGPETEKTQTEIRIQYHRYLLPRVNLTLLHFETERSRVYPSLTIDFHCKGK